MMTLALISTWSIILSIISGTFLGKFHTRDHTTYHVITHTILNSTSSGIKDYCSHTFEHLKTRGQKNLYNISHIKWI